MREDDIFKQTGEAYLCLIHPVLQDDAYRREIASVIELAPSVPDELITAMISGPSWRERLIGFCMAMSKQPATFTEAMVQSLRDPRGIAIVPACAALAVLARRGIYEMTDSFAQMFDRTAFDGEVGWAADKAVRFVGPGTGDISESGPNYGQIFADHVEVYRWISVA